jgi:tRNA-2-methylthio-N6-dimethylallyladenosine synthase
MARIRQVLPDAAVSSDFIVGFCGETEAEFRETIQLVEQCRFKNAFIFKYSQRPGTKAAERNIDDVPWEVKRRRNNQLLAIQNAISQQDNQRFIGREVEVLVEGPSKAAEKDAPGPTLQMTGRTACDRIVVFDGSPRQAGQLRPVTIYDASSHTLFGQLATDPSGPEVHTLALPVGQRSRSG